MKISEKTKQAKHARHTQETSSEWCLPDERKALLQAQGVKGMAQVFVPCRGLHFRTGLFTTESLSQAIEDHIISPADIVLGSAILTFHDGGSFV